ncbi:zf-TFIIB domain-containing protein [Actinocrispum wychmicini]|uniref:Zn-finger nucleic acid-binding protein n=1 Tax=Actinocrispum wychmicini TaxID=1213861 RepID=A0A4R2JMS8_9PSEU|nr:zf-TFIIB domain-containing protein [Actinocrispum wychmicini]TCO60604.1 Zn-finger nucleic acid-binding protein [Actinocrispum wychmicini]
MNDILCPTDGDRMTTFRRSGVPLQVCPTCEATLLPAGGLDQILASERQTGPPAYQQPQQYPDYQRPGKHGGRRGGWGGMFGGGGHH